MADDLSLKQRVLQWLEQRRQLEQEATAPTYLVTLEDKWTPAEEAYYQSWARDRQTGAGQTEPVPQEESYGVGELQARMRAVEAVTERHHATEDLGFSLGAPAHREITSAEAALTDVRLDRLRERAEALEASETQQLQQHKRMSY